MFYSNLTLFKRATGERFIIADLFVTDSISNCMMDNLCWNKMPSRIIMQQTDSLQLTSTLKTIWDKCKYHIKATVLKNSNSISAQAYYNSSLISVARKRDNLLMNTAHRNSF